MVEAYLGEDAEGDLEWRGVDSEEEEVLQLLEPSSVRGHRSASPPAAEAISYGLNSCPAYSLVL
ncbi:unnamed protein product [Prunus armeniaca]|uniref:Uncharacterized protein n=1 Tax=Prunus armeniaca TaxID=36596 RepID=A0A6J5XXN4_PRUAR|nr:unnamed protein product [Prunus armeniaca]